LRGKRQRGALAWAKALFVRKYGEHGMTTLGGKDALLQRLAASLATAKTSLAASSAVGREYLSAIRGQSDLPA
jgi:hypothetical protein